MTSPAQYFTIIGWIGRSLNISYRPPKALLLVSSRALFSAAEIVLSFSAYLLSLARISFGPFLIPISVSWTSLIQYCTIKMRTMQEGKTYITSLAVISRLWQRNPRLFRVAYRESLTFQSARLESKWELWSPWAGISKYCQSRAAAFHALARNVTLVVSWDSVWVNSDAKI